MLSGSSGSASADSACAAIMLREYADRKAALRAKRENNISFLLHQINVMIFTAILISYIVPFCE